MDFIGCYPNLSRSAVVFRGRSSTERKEAVVVSGRLETGTSVSNADFGNSAINNSEGNQKRIVV